MGQMFALGVSGHDNVVKWGQNAAEIAVARAAFDEYRRRGFALFALDEDDEQGERLTEFNPELHGIMAVPRMQGG